MNNLWSLSDFSETVGHYDNNKIKKEDIEEVLCAWGSTPNDDGGGNQSDGFGTEWSGGFVLKLKNGKYAYITGWNDYTGWGCQDGIEIRIADSFEGLELPEDYKEWEEKPKILNDWIKGKVKGFLEE